MEKGKIIKNGMLNLENLIVDPDQKSFMDEIMGAHVKKITSRIEDIINESLEVHFKMPLTEDTYKKMTIVTFENEPGKKYYVLNKSDNEPYFLEWDKVVAYIEDEEPKFSEVENSTFFKSGFKFWSPVKNSKYLT